MSVPQVSTPNENGPEKTVCGKYKKSRNANRRKKNKKKQDLVAYNCDDKEKTHCPSSAITCNSLGKTCRDKLSQEAGSCTDYSPSLDKNAKGKREDGGKSRGSPRHQSGTPKSEEKLLTDTKFPKYLSVEEMDCVSKFGILFSGVIRINQKNFKEAYISAPDKGMDILIMGLIDRNRALEGDEVYYVLKGEEHFRMGRDDGEVQRTAAVVAIKNPQHCRGAVGTLTQQCSSSGKVFFTPRDTRFPRILIRKNNLPSWFSEKLISTKRLFYAKIEKWEDVRYAEGILTKEVGWVGDIESETSAILLMFGLDGTPYSNALKTYFPKLPYVISEADLSNRQDLRNECIFTVDPVTAKDLDDAVSCKRLPNGNYRIGVHISDVTYFLHEGSPLDAAVAEKATTIYMVQKVYHMLPQELCELCSLNPGEDKLAFSVFWEMTPEFEIVVCNFTRSVIHSCGKFSYDQVQEILEGCENPALPEIHGNHAVQDVIDSVKMLNRIAVHLRKKRFENGSLMISQTKIVFSLDEAGLPIDYHIYVNKEAHRLIEEFMLLANIAVARRIDLHFPNVAMLRSHFPPQSLMMGRIQKDLEKYGLYINISSSKALHESLVKYSGSDPQSMARMIVLNAFFAKPMTRANYYCSYFCPKEAEKRHYALNFPIYTHFTSPIRRYADVMVHRLLAASLGYSKAPVWTPEEVQTIANNCNRKKSAAKMAGEKSTELFLNKYIMERGSLICRGAVCEVKQKVIDFILIENGSHQKIYLENMKVGWSVENVSGISKLIVEWPKTEDRELEVQVIERFSIIKVELKTSKDSKKIKTVLLRPDKENDNFEG